MASGLYGWWFTAAQDMTLTAVKWIYQEGPDGEYKKEFYVWLENGEAPLLQGEVSDDTKIDPLDPTGRYRVHVLPPDQELLLEEGKRYAIVGTYEFANERVSFTANGTFDETLVTGVLSAFSYEGPEVEPDEGVGSEIFTCSIEVRLISDGTADLRVTGDSVLDGKVNIGGDLLVGNDLTVDGKVTANSSLYVESGGIWVQNGATTTLSGMTTIDHDLYVNRESEFLKRVNVLENVVANGLQVQPPPIIPLYIAGQRTLFQSSATYGWYFTAAQDMVVTTIKWIYQSGADGEYKKEFGLWTEDGADPLFQGEVSDDTNIDHVSGDQNWRINLLPPDLEVLLEEGKRYVMAGYFPSSASRQVFNTGSSLWAAPVVTDVSAAYVTGSGSLEKPTDIGGPILQVAIFEARSPVTGAANLRVTGDSALDGDLSVGGDLLVGNDLKLEGKLEFSGDLKVDGDLEVDGEVDAKTLSVSNEAEFKSRVTFSNQGSLEVPVCKVGS